VTWWTTSGYNLARIAGRVVSGDFDKDGYEDDIAAFYDYGNGQTRIHVWLTDTTFFGQVSGFDYQWSSGWWSAFGYTAGRITGRVVSGDFDHDGDRDDIAAFYDYESGETRIHIWRSTGSSFQYAGSSGWWSANNYSASKITHNVISGDFDRDGSKDDIAAFYNYGNSQTAIHTWRSSGSSFHYSYSPGWWNTTGYDTAKISGRIVAGDFDRDGRLDDITAVYDYSSSCGGVRSHVWQSAGSSLSYINQSLGYPWMTDFPYYQ